MLPTIEQYVSFLRDAKVAGGFPMVAMGMGLMLFGWRMWKVCVVLSFGIIGFAATLYYVGLLPNKYWFAGCIALFAAVLSYYTAKHALTLLGGLIVAGIAYAYLQNFNLDQITLLGLTAAALIVGLAFALINRQRIVILVTAFLGAILLMSGLASWALAFPGFFNTVRYLAERSLIVIPFLLLVPTAMSCFYQIAEVRRIQADL